MKEEINECWENILMLGKIKYKMEQFYLLRKFYCNIRHHIPLPVPQMAYFSWIHILSQD